MKILLYSRAFPPAVGGMERFAEDLAGWLADQGNDVWVGTNTPKVSSSDAGRPFRVLRAVRTSDLMAAARWADAVHISGLALRAIVPLLFVARRPVVTHHGYQAICPTGLAWAPEGGCSAGPEGGPCLRCPQRGITGSVAVTSHRLGARAAARNVCVSRYLQNRLGLSKSITIYNPVSSRMSTAEGPSREQQGLIAFAGRLVAEKGLGVLLRALAEVPDACLEVGGDGPMRAAWEDLARRLGLGRRVTFLGQLSLAGVAELYMRAALVCVPSAWDEPFGYAAAEAMAAGKAVVASPSGALPELLGDGRGFVAAAGAPDALAEVLRSALHDPDGRRRAGARARDFASRELDIDVVGRHYVAMYEEAAA